MNLNADVGAFLDRPNFGVLATTNRDGSCQQTLMWYALDGDDIVMNTAAGRRKHHNIAARPRVSLCVVEGRQYVTLEGLATVERDDPELHRHIGSRYENDEALDRLFAESYDVSDRITIRMTIDNVLDGLNV